MNIFKIKYPFSFSFKKFSIIINTLILVLCSSSGYAKFLTKKGVQKEISEKKDFPIYIKRFESEWVSSGDLLTLSFNGKKKTLNEENLKELYRSSSSYLHKKLNSFLFNHEVITFQLSNEKDPSRNVQGNCTIGSPIFPEQALFGELDMRFILKFEFKKAGVFNKKKKFTCTGYIQVIPENDFD